MAGPVIKDAFYEAAALQNPVLVVKKHFFGLGATKHVGLFVF